MTSLLALDPRTNTNLQLYFLTCLTQFQFVFEKHSDAIVPLILRFFTFFDETKLQRSEIKFLGLTGEALANHLLTEN